MNLKNSREVQSNLVPLYLKNKRLGKVHSKFKNGLNIQFEDELIYISHIQSPLSAHGINIFRDKLQKIMENVNIGDIVIFKENKLVFYSTYNNIVISLEEIDKVDLRIPGIQINRREIKNTVLYGVLRDYDFKNNIGLELDDKSYRYINLLIESDKRNSKLNNEIIKFFAGRGKGLTPSGDDILTGFTIALLAFNEENCFSNWIKDIRFIVDEKLTTEISIAYLKALTKGYLSYNFIELIYSINFKEKKIIYEGIDKIKKIGHTSGNDTLFGFYLGLEFLIRN
ncbi:DUF2877 domain-containing protein [Clostridium nigeriense]|uniref:DUF2877 domain-containing protein n=1 Tax=Clostridium nigeriense TaxID=1805470 RepID=UPI00082C2D24|nr:DUF2877 domain-containing protein [Clostridium nigeriense]